jgi:hypothetical protein
LWNRFDQILWAGLNLRQASLGFVALNPAYNWSVELPAAKLNKGRFCHQAPEVPSRPDWALAASGAMSLTPEHRHLKPPSYDNIFSEKLDKRVD